MGKKSRTTKYVKVMQDARAGGGWGESQSVWDTEHRGGVGPASRITSFTAVMDRQTDGYCEMI